MRITSAQPSNSTCQEGHKMHLQAALCRTGGHYPSPAGAITSTPPSSPCSPSAQLPHPKPPEVGRLLTTQVIRPTSAHLGGLEGRPLSKRNRMFLEQEEPGGNISKETGETSFAEKPSSGRRAAGDSRALNRGLAPSRCPCDLGWVPSFLWASVPSNPV